MKENLKILIDQDFSIGRISSVQIIRRDGSWSLHKYTRDLSGRIEYREDSKFKGNSVFWIRQIHNCSGGYKIITEQNIDPEAKKFISGWRTFANPATGRIEQLVCELHHNGLRFKSTQINTEDGKPLGSWQEVQKGENSLLFYSEKGEGNVFPIH